MQYGEANQQVFSDFSMRSAYFALRNGPRFKSLPPIWKLRAPHRFRIFWWLLSLNRILTTENCETRAWVLNIWKWYRDETGKPSNTRKRKSPDSFLPIHPLERTMCSFVQGAIQDGQWTVWRSEIAMESLKQWTLKCQKKLIILFAVLIFCFPFFIFYFLCTCFFFLFLCFFFSNIHL